MGEYSKLQAKRWSWSIEFLRYVAACYQGLKSNFVHHLLYESKTQKIRLSLSVPSHNYATEVYYRKLL